MIFLNFNPNTGELFATNFITVQRQLVLRVRNDNSRTHSIFTCLLVYRSWFKVLGKNMCSIRVKKQRRHMLPTFLRRLLRMPSTPAAPVVRSTRPIYLKLVQDGGGVMCVAEYQDGTRVEPGGKLFSITDQGDLFLWAHVNPIIGFQLDEHGHIVTE